MVVVEVVTMEKRVYPERNGHFTTVPFVPKDSKTNIVSMFMSGLTLERNPYAP